MKRVDSYKELSVYKRLFEIQYTLFCISKPWPRSEVYALTDQLRRSSRAIGANVAEAWAKRHYPAHFASKLSDADAELQETKHWLDTAVQCGYLNAADRQDIARELDHAGRQLGRMIVRSDAFCRKTVPR
jgi:four helix bundle protein